MGSIEEAASPVTFPTYDRPVYANDFWGSLVPGKTDLGIGLTPEAKERFVPVQNKSALPNYGLIISNDLETIRQLDESEKKHILDFYKGTQHYDTIKRSFEEPDIRVKVTGKWEKASPLIPLLVVGAAIAILFWGSK